jgi:hypothetical protein
MHILLPEEIQIGQVGCLGWIVVGVVLLRMINGIKCLVLFILACVWMVVEVIQISDLVKEAILVF